jgi:hypothetical protein
MISEKWGSTTLTSYLSKSGLLVVQMLPKWGGMIQEAPQAHKMIKNKISQNGVKPISLRPSHYTNSGHIFIFSNEHHMRDLSHFD